MTSLNPTTGKDDGFVHLNISGQLPVPRRPSNATRVYNQSLSHGGTLDLVDGRLHLGRRPAPAADLHAEPGHQPGARSPAGPRRSGTAARARPRRPTHQRVPLPVRHGRAVLHPGRRLVAGRLDDLHRAPPGTTRTAGRPGRRRAPACATRRRRSRPPRASVLHEWVNYTGCDSLYAAAADASTAYFGGHERWSRNPNDCDAAGPGAINAPGMEGLSPATGAAHVQPDAGAAGSVPTTCSSPAPGCGSPATTWTAARCAAACQSLAGPLPPALQVGHGRDVQAEAAQASSTSAGSAGAARTLIERLLAELPGVCSVGEVVHLWQRGVVRRRALRLRRAVQRLRVLAGRSARPRSAAGTGSTPAASPGCAARSTGPGTSRCWPRPCSRAVRRALRRVPRLLPAALLGDRGGQRLRHGWSIPASTRRWPSASAGAPRLDLRVIHVVRDSRAVAYSWTQR